METRSTQNLRRNADLRLPGFQRHSRQQRLRSRGHYELGFPELACFIHVTDLHVLGQNAADEWHGHRLLLRSADELIPQGLLLCAQLAKLTEHSDGVEIDTAAGEAGTCFAACHGTFGGGRHVVCPEELDEGDDSLGERPW